MSTNDFTDENTKDPLIKRKDLAAQPSTEIMTSNHSDAFPQ